MVVVGCEEMNTHASNICSSVLVRGSQIISILSVKWGRGKMKRGKGCGGGRGSSSIHLRVRVHWFM